jgi:hypothetical protein
VKVYEKMDIALARTGFGDQLGCHGNGMQTKGTRETSGQAGSQTC